MGSVAANPWRTRVLSRYTVVESLAPIIACGASLIFPVGPVLVVVAWIFDPAVAGFVAIAWMASGLLVVIPTISEPIVTWLVRAREPTPDELHRLKPAWDDVCRRTALSPHRFALRVWPAPPGVINAFSAGGNVVGVTDQALMLLDDEALRAVLAHEAGHHAGYDALPRAIAAWYLGLLEALLRPLWPFGAGAFLRAVYLPILFVLALTSRACEFGADAFAARVGFGRQLSDLLLRLGEDTPRSLTSAVLATHPASADRARRLEEARLG
jgi:Zn-dependent protease with chaperone function